MIVTVKVLAAIATVAVAFATTEAAIFDTPVHTTAKTERLPMKVDKPCYVPAFVSEDGVVMFVSCETAYRDPINWLMAGEDI